MTLVWHICAKDFRRLRLYWLAWLAGLVLLTAWAAWGSGPVFTGALQPMVESLGRWYLYFRIASVALYVAGFALAGALAFADPALGANAFWKTRPVSGRRLAVAKLVAGTGLLVVAPLLALALLWALAGCAPGQILLMATSQAGPLMVSLVLGFSLAALSEQPGEHLFVGLLAYACGSLVVIFPEPFLVLTEVRNEAGRDAASAAVALGLTCLLALGWLQYAIRARLRWWTVFAVLLPGLLAVRLLWPVGRPTDLAPVGNEPRLRVEGFQRTEAGVVTLRLVSPRDGAGPWLAPWSGQVVLRFPDGRAERRFGLSAAPSWGEAAARQAAGLGDTGKPTDWSLARAGYEPRGGEAAFAGEVDVAITKADVMNRLPLKAGGIGRNASSRIEILAIRTGAASIEVLLHDRTALFSSSPGNDDESRDFYFLQEIRSKRFVRLEGSRWTSVRAGMMARSLLALRPADPLPPGFHEAAAASALTLIRVRLTRGETTPLSIPPLAFPAQAAGPSS